MTDKDSNKSKNPAQATPIVDGDARPDQLDEKRINKKLKGSDKANSGKFSSNRQGDVNSLEDYKDEK
jgi:hypothetical protein